MSARRVLVSGRVQGVGYRAWAADTAERLGLNGWVRNLPDGRVEAVISGDAVDEMLKRMETGPTFASVSEVRSEETEGEPAPGFAIRH